MPPPGIGHLSQDEGTIRWHGAPVRAWDRVRFGYMPEERGLYPRMRVRDQLTYLGQLCGRAPRDVTRSVDAWLQRLGLAGRAADRLDALSHGAGRPGHHPMVSFLALKRR